MRRGSLLLIAMLLVSGCSLLVDPVVADGDELAPDDGSGPGPAGGGQSTDSGTLRVFVTLDGWNGDLRGSEAVGGAEAADERCLLAGAKAGLNGHFMAWITDDVRAEDRLPDDGPWQLVGSDELVFASRDQFATGPAVAIDRNEYGARMAPTLVWTGTPASTADSIPGDRCNQWNGSYYIGPNGDASYRGLVGYSGATDQQWTEMQIENCTSEAHLYCFEYWP